jgi:hypothetical protein
MPADQGCRFNDYQGRSPIKEPRPEHQPESSCVGQPSRANFAFLVERKLLAKKEILGNQSCSRAEAQPHEAGEIANEFSKNFKRSEN